MSSCPRSHRLYGPDQGCAQVQLPPEPRLTHSMRGLTFSKAKTFQLICPEDLGSLTS